MDDFKKQTMHGHGSLWDACNIQEGAPLHFEDFANCVASFKPPLNSAQARYAFDGLDLDENGSIQSSELHEVFRIGHFYPTPNERNEAAESRTTHKSHPHYLSLPLWPVIVALGL